ncbi:copper resistance protein CopN [Cupriavidus metallidurans]|uniref:copper resistance protein CopN n=1 Tax=Cupriavidus metallidurans TaxID=119219 RepID=UPI001D132106|nr:copper resistance protein CopN [Cupriavidus metallidurans]
MRRIKFGIFGLAGLSGLVAHAHIIPVPDVHPAAAAYLAPGAAGKTLPVTEWVVEVDHLDGQPASRAVRTGETVSLSLRNLGDKSIDIAVVLSQSEAMTPMANSQPVTIHLLGGNGRNGEYRQRNRCGSLFLRSLSGRSRALKAPLSD